MIHYIDEYLIVLHNHQSIDSPHNLPDAPDYMTFDLGYKHKTKINSTPVTLTAMCYNVLGKDYWISRGTSVALGAPRTMMLSAQFDI